MASSPDHEAEPEESMRKGTIERAAQRTAREGSGANGLHPLQSYNNPGLLKTYFPIESFDQTRVQCA